MWSVGNNHNFKPEKLLDSRTGENDGGGSIKVMQTPKTDQLFYVNTREWPPAESLDDTIQMMHGSECDIQIMMNRRGYTSSWGTPLKKRK